MRSLKRTGGLTRGRGMSEIQRTSWLSSIPACAEMNQAMQEIIGMNYKIRMPRILVEVVIAMMRCKYCAFCDKDLNLTKVINLSETLTLVSQLINVLMLHRLLTLERKLFRIWLESL
ncbi:hypothetical protein DPMN_156829 [Dreissena polymorpha]|uniref:Uncharacterized protein n=1 Tax=Dreissena polymorpha TaxID=45954 RepID=A0A9D4FLK8_DREPO|nr:hypothetical protein DPMN_152307 [Dreissena polymorpha]KAH3803127.1 hypothetical protein DPMN_156829 [Dreissena polymorpha]